MLWLSEVLLQHQDDMESFADLVEAVQAGARAGEFFFRMDVKPSFQDTPADWENRLEAAFSSATQSKG